MESLSPTSPASHSRHYDDYNAYQSEFEPAQSYYDLQLTENQSRHGTRWASVIGIAALVVLGCWIVLTSVYIILHDDLLASAIQNRLRMQSDYENRIADLRGEIGAVTGRLMLNQDEFDTKVERLNTRQAMLEERQSEIASLIEDVDQTVLALGETDITGSVGPQHAHAGGNDTIQTGNTIRLAFAAQHDAVTVSRQGYDIIADANLPANPQNRADRDLLRLASEQYKLESDQFATLNEIERRAESAALIIAEAITRLGYTPQDAPESASSANDGIGGPLIQITPQILPAQSSFERQLQRIRTHAEKANNLYRSLVAFPIRSPLTENHQVSSGFGSRIDPFRRTQAFHSGVDMRANRGVAVRATADGVVVMARRNAGYGKMVEISHANGLSTRYAHMSRITVAEGEQVEAGDIVGRVGSTGRSTGPHLHYETRRNGNPVNPRRFIEIGASLF
ncbi:MAG: M23 family metallopeptidase [Fimbriimonadaceae bacterium]|nr:M23 family metallopeptidase [Alphaproteobacteria bacterium]